MNLKTRSSLQFLKVYDLFFQEAKKLRHDFRSHKSSYVRATCTKHENEVQTNTDKKIEFKTNMSILSISVLLPSYRV